MNYYKDKETGDVHAYDDEQMAVIARINAPDFDNEKEQVPAIFFEIDGRIKGMHKMTKKEVEVHINPPVTKEQLIAEAEARKQALIAEANAAIAPLQDAVDLGMITPVEEAALKEWKIYRVLLSRVNTSTAPDTIWPVKPTL
ncbi:tail fiber assembly protein [Morganella morganii]|uniref:tail fiber assembly protein n=1 Tax=Morganella morganii TaxID=582 RepID=UPI0023ECAE73|nr:tail fiber assembly protein [Morganella morganii]